MSQQGLDAIALSIPIFFLLIGVELWVEWRERRRLYRLNDSINDLACGTIQQEEEEPAYGVTRPLATWNPVWANFQYFAELWSVARRTRRRADRVRIFIKPPGWRPADVPFEPVSSTPTEGLKYDATPPRGLAGYATVQFLLALGAAIALLFFEPRLALGQERAIALFAVWTFLDVGGLYNRRSRVLPAEIGRWGCVAIALGVLAPAPWHAAGAVAAALVGALSIALIATQRSSLRAAGTVPLPVAPAS